MLLVSTRWHIRLIIHKPPVVGSNPTAALSDSGLVANLQLFLNLNDILEEVTKHGQMDLVNGLSRRYSI